ncbi:isochorismatase family protein [Flavobacteriaceae bacterium]|nr:isochorismatase family protein [Flavobacteriaceae bacterium]MDB9712778.1 isochorismatase family protein [Flavobacteriaceae bacterium]MDC1491765.1 isochorismatase family protein [Flavobacteriaceae bacterium]
MNDINLNITNTALILVDVQKAFLDKDYPGLKRNNPNAEKVCGSILNKCRELNLPVIHIRHSSTNIDSKLHDSKPGFLFNDYVLPLDSEFVLTKNVNSGFIGTNLQNILTDLKVNTLVFAGMTTNHCISSTVRMSGNLGYETYLISDATAAYNTIGVDGKMIDCEIIYNTSLANLNDEFATILSSKELFNYLK